MTKAVEYVCEHINEILQLPIDMNCMNSEVVKRLARIIPIETLLNLKDKKDKLMSKLYMKKLEVIFEDE